MAKQATIFMALSFLAIALPAAGKARPELIRPTVSERGTLLHTSPGRARVESAGGVARRIPIGSDDLLTAIVETRYGWAVSGVREKGTGTALVLWQDFGDGARAFPTPGNQRYALRLRPVLLVERGDLAGIAWLEGVDVGSLAVHVAAFADSTWSDIEVVASPAARGSQTGLTGTILRDGSWLLAWSAFDGHDDEIVWSRRQGEEWSLPRRLTSNHRAPDVLPDLVASKRGALMSWSRMRDGHYELMMSSFDSGTWSKPRVVGPPGSIEPAFALTGSRMHLVYRHAWPAGWSVLELSQKGAVKRWAVFASREASRPVLEASTKGAVVLRWPDSQTQTSRWERTQP